MPEMDGFAMLEGLRKIPKLEKVPVVVLTAKQLTAEEKSMLSGRTERVLAKKATSNLELAEAIRRCIPQGAPAGQATKIAS
jgi:CheY-like chemotaxis protein